jgi:hypothetical protein
VMTSGAGGVLRSFGPGTAVTMTACTAVAGMYDARIAAASVWACCWG